MQQLEIGKIYTGKVKGIKNYGAFVDIDGGGSGMVHISEVANTFVSDIHEHLTENQEVKVKVIGINEEGKVSLSIKKALPPSENVQQKQKRYGNDRQNDKNTEKNNERNNSQKIKPVVWEPKKTIPQSEMSFEDMMSHFKQSSEEKMCDIKRNTDRKNKSKRK